jgi:hypothetical protein
MLYSQNEVDIDYIGQGGIYSVRIIRTALTRD